MMAGDEWLVLKEPQRQIMCNRALAVVGWLLGHGMTDDDAAVIEYGSLVMPAAISAHNIVELLQQRGIALVVHHHGLHHSQRVILDAVHPAHGVVASTASAGFVSMDVALERLVLLLSLLVSVKVPSIPEEVPCAVGPVVRMDRDGLKLVTLTGRTRSIDLVGLEKRDLAMVAGKTYQLVAIEVDEEPEVE